MYTVHVYCSIIADLIVSSRQKYNHALLKIDLVCKRLAKRSECYGNDTRT